MPMELLYLLKVAYMCAVSLLLSLTHGHYLIANSTKKAIWTLMPVPLLVKINI